jgi:NitT/TauT family transport system permease protein
VKGLSVLVVLILWEAVGRLTSPLFFSTPVRTFSALVDMAMTGTLFVDLVVTLESFLSGLAISVVLGIAVGTVVGYFRQVRVAVDHYVVALNATPYVVWMPLIILWLGIGEAARTTVVVLAAIWPMIINLMYGIAYADEALIEVGRVFGCTSGQLLYKVVLPSSIPFIASGFRLSVGRALVGALVAEMFLQLTGLGGSLLRYGDLLQPDRVFALMFTTMALALSLTALGRWVELKGAAWKVSA